MLLCYLLLKCWRTNFSSLTRLVCCTVKEKGQIQPGSWTQNKGRFPTLCTAANQPSPLRNRKLLKTEVLYSEVTDSWRSVGTVRPTMHVCTHTRLQVWAITFQLLHLLYPEARVKYNKPVTSFTVARRHLASQTKEPTLSPVHSRGWSLSPLKAFTWFLLWTRTASDSR